MQNSKDIRETLETFVEKLADDRLPEIDLDRLTAALRGIVDRLAQAESQADELRLLKEDYRLRLAGMLKAIAVVERRRGAMERALDEIAELESLTAEQLRDRHRKISARFRDAFPASYGLVRTGTGLAPRDLADFK